MRPTILLLLVGMTLSPVARADDCSNASDQATMSECAGKALQKSDAELNATYDQIRQRLKNAPETLKLLVGAQRAWIAFRDAECDFSTSPSAGGTIHPHHSAPKRDKLAQYLWPTIPRREPKP